MADPYSEIFLYTGMIILFCLYGVSLLFATFITILYSNKKDNDKKEYDTLAVLLFRAFFLIITPFFIHILFKDYFNKNKIIYAIFIILTVFSYCMNITSFIYYGRYHYV